MATNPPVAVPFDEAIPSDFQADLDAVIASVMSGTPLDPEVARRLNERADRIRQEVYEKFGELDIGVPAIRELRGELPE